jgi:hypothetical protein
MKVSIDRKAFKNKWMEWVSDNLKAGNNVALQNANFDTDLVYCYQLAHQFHAHLFIDADTATCHFLISN